MQEGVLAQSFKPLADEMLRDVMESQGAFKVTANLFHLAVKEFGGLHMKAKPVIMLPIK